MYISWRNEITSQRITGPGQHIISIGFLNIFLSVPSLNHDSLYAINRYIFIDCNEQFSDGSDYELIVSRKPRLSDQSVGCVVFAIKERMCFLSPRFDLIYIPVAVYY